MKSKEAVQRRLAKYWNTILLWSGYDGYWEIKVIARALKVRVSTVEQRLQWFKKHFPEAYEKIKQDRAHIRSASCRLDKQLEEMNEGRFISLDAMPSDISESLIKEKF